MGDVLVSMICNKEAEMSILGALFLDNEAMERVVKGSVESSDFYEAAHREIFATMEDMLKKSIPLDIITIADELQKRRKLEEVGGQEYLAELVAAIPVEENLNHYCRIVKEKSRHRQIAASASEVLAEMYSGTDATESMKRLQCDLAAVIGYPKRHLKCL